MSPLTEGRGLKQTAARRIWCSSTSPLTEGRGLKPHIYPNVMQFSKVAPHRGAWIETLKVKLICFRPPVAPHRGAWIETRMRCMIILRHVVAPHRGAWIETEQQSWPQSTSTVSPLTEGRGLKLRLGIDWYAKGGVAPHRGAWIETVLCLFSHGRVSGRPSQRGVD